MKTKHLRWLWTLLLLPLFRQEASAQTATPKDTVIVSDTLRWTWTAKAGEEKEFTIAVKTPGLYRVCWGDDSTYDYRIFFKRSLKHQYLQAGSYEMKMFGLTPDTIPNEIVETVLGINMVLVYVEGGTFTMGATWGQGEYAFDDERPMHDVTLDGFYIGRFEVTQAQWEAVMGTNPCSCKYGLGDDYPVYDVSWPEAVEFCEKLSEMTGRKYRLPTEAEWEYAARGGQKTHNYYYTYAGSNKIGNVAWYDFNSSKSSHPVGQKQPNGLGLYDMSGNVWEWCSDWYDKNYYDSSPATNPRGPQSGSSRVARGGGWADDARDCRVSGRNVGLPGDRDVNLGFRVAVSL